MPDAKQIECPSCALMIAEDAETCPYCGYERPPQQKSSVKAVAVIMALLLLYPLFKVVQYLLR